MYYTDDFMADVMGIERLPDVLFHYTSIETLALILETKSLRLGRLDSVNDPEEASACDLPNAATLVFASCWTSQERESLAMWRMYTPNMQGLRIALPNNPFAGRHEPTIFEKGGAMQRFDGRITIHREKGDHGITSCCVTGPNKIYYTDELKYRNGRCLDNDGSQWTVQLHDLGMFKSTYWSFEEEWRFKLLATFSEGILNSPNPASHPAFDLESYPVVETAVFVPLDVECLQNMEVLLGPCVNTGQELLVKALLQKFAPNAKLRSSEIRVRPPR
ncbi:DUF2971 domain-containing protein [Diaphorobacter sp. HDW4A]|uniref:DUF2971 domain-containing protein n=1 Tax=Diaphorobacter sp. HDW4A TaxID=2714924 RepID=UPI00140C4B73|nr:DUF2971 domain-containing protein [Diaphorobacter sp. HDW4A]QIL80726.1 DUF2971 domain-containing protein [Diaphorobacter sp. HDW4A]